MKKIEFNSLSPEVASLADRIVKEEVTQTQLDYLIQSKNIDEDQLYDAVNYMNGEINKTMLFCSLLMVSLVFSIFSILRII